MIRRFIKRILRNIVLEIVDEQRLKDLEETVFEGRPRG